LTRLSWRICATASRKPRVANGETTREEFQRSTLPRAFPVTKQLIQIIDV
jgi:hypothetical protein